MGKLKLIPGEKVLYKMQRIALDNNSYYTDELTVTDQSVIIEKISLFLERSKGITRIDYHSIDQAVFVRGTGFAGSHLDLYVNGTPIVIKPQSNDDDEIQVVIQAIKDQKNLGIDSPEYDFMYYQDLLSSMKKNKKGLKKQKTIQQDFQQENEPYFGNNQPSPKTVLPDSGIQNGQKASVSFQKQIEYLEKAKGLLDDRILTQEEYDSIKRRILDGYYEI